MKVPMPKTRNLHNDIQANHKTDKDLKMVCMEKSDSNIKSHVSSEIYVNLDSSEMSIHSSSQINNKTENERSHVSKINRGRKSTISLISKEIKPRCGVPFSNKSTYHNKPVKHTLPKRKLQPVVSHLTNTSAKVVLFERNVEIKDLESKVKYQHNQIQKLENENKTLQNVQSRQERELKMFKEGVADIPSLLRSHKEETKMYETTLSNIRRERRDCQKDIKNKNEVLLKKESHIDKLNVSLKQCEKRIRESSCELKELKAEKLHIQDEYKLLSEATANLKSLHEDQQKKFKNMTHQIQILEENLIAEKEEKRQLKDDIQALKKKFDLLELKVSFESFVSPVTVNCLQGEGNSCTVSLEDERSEVNLDSKLFTAEITKKHFLKKRITQKEDTSRSVSLEDKRSEISPDSKIFTAETTESVEENGLYLDKSNDVLIQPLKQHYRDLSSPNFGECSFNDSKTSNHNSKLLPPLKQPCKKYSQNPLKDDFDQECSSPSSQYETKNRNNEWHSEVLEKYFQNRLKPNKICKINSKPLQ